MKIGCLIREQGGGVHARPGCLRRPFLLPGPADGEAQQKAEASHSRCSVSAPRGFIDHLGNLPKNEHACGEFHHPVTPITCDQGRSTC